MKRSLIFLLFVVLISVSFVSAQVENESSVPLDELEEEFGDAELSVSEGITPDSAFYFIDEFFERFGDDLRNREEKIAEIRAMIAEGKTEEARIALARYKEFAERLEQEVDPEDREEARRSSAAIRNVLSDLEEDISEDDREDFIEDILEYEEALVTAVEIATKIKELCQTLSKLDPLEYSKVCRTTDKAPDWHRKLDKDLTNEQRKEALEFGKIMSECFQTSGEKCRCEDISFVEFAEQCSIIAPLAYACDVLDDENSCDKMDEIEEENDIFGLLPDYLQDVLEDLENQYDDASYENHIPGPCRDVGIDGTGKNDREECFRIMVEHEAPQPCVDALKDGRIKISNERAFREACEELIFDEEAPIECIEAGITNFRECGKFMFEQNAPEICIEHGLTGDHQADRRKCEELARGEFGDDGRGPGPGFGFDCGRIEDSIERLECYDKAATGAHDRFEDSRSFEERFEETMERERQCAEGCLREGGAWDFSNGECSCRFRDYEDDYKDDFGKTNGGGIYDDCGAVDCSQGYHCEYGNCIQDDFYEEETRPTEDEPYLEPITDPTQETPPVEEQPTTDPTQEETTPDTEEPSTDTTTDTSTQTDTSSSEPESITTSESTITGSVIRVDNKFFNYYFR